MCEELAACDTNMSAAVCWDQAPLLAEPWFLLGESGARNSRPTCLPELPWGLNSIQQTSTDAYSVPGPVLGEAGDRGEEPQPLPAGRSVYWGDRHAHSCSNVPD